MVNPNQFSDIGDTTLSDAVETAMNFLEESYADLAVLRQEISTDESGTTSGVEEEPVQQSSPAELATKIAARMEACAATLRKAADSES